MSNFDLRSTEMSKPGSSFEPEHENVVTKKAYQKPVLLKYGEVTRLTMKTGPYSDFPLEGGMEDPGTGGGGT